jgi:hypothetical protein
MNWRKRDIGPLFMYIGYLEYTYVHAPLRKLWRKWKARKQAAEVKRKYLTATGLPMPGDVTIDGTRLVCDHTNNTVEDIEKGILNVDIYPPEPLEYINLNFIASANGISFSEIVEKPNDDRK